MEFAQHVHCAHCKQREFLPFECKSCAASFCLSHRTRESHECPAWIAEQAAARAAPKPAPIALPVKFKCSKRGCKVKEIISINCRNCAHNFCIAHRFPTQHQCESFGKQTGAGGSSQGAAAVTGGLHRNTILPAGIVPPRPLDADRSSRHSTQPLASAPAPAPAPLAVLAAAPAAPTVAQPSSSAASVHASADAPLATEPTAARITSPLLFQVSTNNGSSCAAEMSQAASAAATKSDVAEATSSNAAATTAVATPAAAAMRHHNTNIAHLSKLLKQHS